MKVKKLPGQSQEISSNLKLLLERANAECSRNIRLMIGPAESDCEGSTEWTDSEIIIRLQSGQDAALAEYIAAHELGHVFQYIRGYAIAAGRTDEPEAVTIAMEISDFVMDALADSLAQSYGFPIEAGFSRYYRSSDMLDILDIPADGRHFGTHWERVWDKLTEIRVCRRLGNKMPKLPREYGTIIFTLSLANIIKRANNLDPELGPEIMARIAKQRLLATVINDLLGIDKRFKYDDIEVCVSKLGAIFDYFKLQPGHIQLYKPLTDEILAEGHWQPKPQNRGTSIFDLIKIKEHP